jgi:hypothetical protein
MAFGVARIGRPVSVAYRAVAAASANVALPVGSAYMLVCDQNCWIEFGNSSVEAAAGAGGSIYLPANTVLVFDKPVVSQATNQTNPTHIAAIRATADGTLTIVGLS